MAGFRKPLLLWILEYYLHSIADGEYACQLFFGSALASTKPSGISKKSLLISGIFFNILLLGYFKYTDFLLDNFNGFFWGILTNYKYHLKLLRMVCMGKRLLLRESSQIILQTRFHFYLNHSSESALLDFSNVHLCFDL